MMDVAERKIKRPYETMFLLSPTVTEERVTTLLERIKEGIEKKAGEINSIDKMGTRQTAYVVNKQKSAYYVLIQYIGSGDTVKEFERILKNMDEVLKFLSTKITTKFSAKDKTANPVNNLEVEATTDKKEVAEQSSVKEAVNNEEQGTGENG